MDTTAQNTGIVSAQDFAAKFPALSASLATKTAQQSGLDPKDPQSIITAMHSNTFQTDVMKAASATDPNVTEKVFQPLQFAPTTASQDTQTNAAFDAKEQNLNNTIAAKQQLFNEQSEAAKQLAELSTFNQSEYKNQRLKALNPTADIDQRMLELRLQAFTASAMLETDPEIMALPPNLQQRAMASKMAVFNDAISSLSKVRETRLAAANDQIDSEIQGKSRQINTATSRVSALDAQIKHLSEIGADQDAIASLRLDRIKEQERLNKARSKSGGMSTQKEFVYQALQAEYRKTHGAPATGADADTLKYQAERIVATDPEAASKAGSTVSTTENVTTTTPGGFDWRFFTRLPAKTTVTPVTKEQDYLTSRGYGVPIGANEALKTRAERLDYAKKLEDAGQKDAAKAVRAQVAK